MAKLISLCTSAGRQILAGAERGVGRCGPAIRKMFCGAASRSAAGIGDFPWIGECLS
jgi:hypothetical protein